MKKNRTITNIKLGTFVLAGVVFLVFSLYMIGKNRNIFGSTFTISAHFRNINGLVPGSNVRFAGSDVGTVKSISVESDTSVLVVMIVDKKMEKFIRKNALASIGTDGLVGNKIVNVNSVRGPSLSVEDGDVIGSLLPVETDEMMRTLQTTNENIAVITGNLKRVSDRLSGSTNLWTILSDTIILKELQSAAKSINHAGSNAQVATEKAMHLMKRFSSGDGLAQAVFADTSLSNSVRRSVATFENTTGELEGTVNDLKAAANGIRNGQGTVGLLISDSTASRKTLQSISNIEEGTAKFNENMEALKEHFLFRGYYRKQAKKASTQAADH